MLSESLSSHNKDLWLCHYRLGHPSFSTLKIMFPSLFQRLGIGVFHCDDCEFAKHKCASFPKISFAINKVCQSVASPMDSHWEVVKRILRYLKGTMSHGLVL